MWTLCVAMVTDMMSQVPLGYSPTIELQGDIQFAHTIKHPSLLSSFVHKQYSNEKPFRASLISVPNCTLHTANLLHLSLIWVPNCILHTANLSHLSLISVPNCTLHTANLSHLSLISVPITAHYTLPIYRTSP